MVATLVKDATLFHTDEILKATFRHDIIKQNNLILNRIAPAFPRSTWPKSSAVQE